MHNEFDDVFDEPLNHEDESKGMKKLERALEIRKAKYLKRTGSPGHYKYIYKETVSKDKQKEVKEKRVVKEGKEVKTIKEMKTALRKIMPAGKVGVMSDKVVKQYYKNWKKDSAISGKKKEVTERGKKESLQVTELKEQSEKRKALLDKIVNGTDPKTGKPYPKYAKDDRRKRVAFGDFIQNKIEKMTNDKIIEKFNELKPTVDKIYKKYTDTGKVTKTDIRVWEMTIRKISKNVIVPMNLQGAQGLIAKIKIGKKRGWLKIDTPLIDQLQKKANYLKNTYDNMKKLTKKFSRTSAQRSASQRASTRMRGRWSE